MPARRGSLRGTVAKPGPLWNISRDPHGGDRSEAAPLAPQVEAHDLRAETPMNPPSRTCGTCTLCCKVLGIQEIDKPAGRWCPHCQPGRGCKIYGQRPDECRTFACLWLTQPFLDEEWRPDTSKLVLHTEHGTDRLTVRVDPGAPHAWRKEPFYGQIRAWARAALASRRQVIVMVGDNATVVLPDADVPVGRVSPGDRIVMHEQAGAMPRIEVERAAR